MFKNKAFLIGFSTILLLIFIILSNDFNNFEIIQGRIFAISKCFNDGQIPCRWIFSAEFPFGSAIFSYSAPFPYYLAGLIFLISKNLFISEKLILSAGFFGTYLFMYILLAKYLSRQKSSFFAFIYSFISFLTIVFSSEGLGVTYGLLLFPLCLLSINSLFQKWKLSNFLSTSLSFGFLILSSDLSGALISIILLWIVFFYLKSRKHIFIVQSLISIVFGILVASFYILPAVLENNLAYGFASKKELRYLPKTVTEVPPALFENGYEILTGSSQVNNFLLKTTHFSFDVDTKTHTIIRLPIFYFPNWKVYIDGKEVQVEYKNNSEGLMTVIVGRGTHVVEGRLFDTAIRTISNVLTIISLIFAGILFTIQQKKVQKWLEYYKNRVN